MKKKIDLNEILELGKIIQRGTSSMSNILGLTTLFVLSYYFNIRNILILLVGFYGIIFLYNTFKYIKWKKKLLKQIM